MIEKKEMKIKWKLGVNYTVVVEAPKNAIISISAEGFYGHSRAMKLGQ